MAVVVDANHVSLLLSDFDSLSVLQIFRTAHDQLIAGNHTGHNLDLAPDRPAEGNRAPLNLAIADRENIGRASFTAHGALANDGLRRRPLSLPALAFLRWRFFAEEGHLHPHVGKYSRVKLIE